MSHNEINQFNVHINCNSMSNINPNFEWYQFQNNCHYIISIANIQYASNGHFGNVSWLWLFKDGLNNDEYVWSLAIIHQSYEHLAIHLISKSYKYPQSPTPDNINNFGESNTSVDNISYFLDWNCRNWP